MFFRNQLFSPLWNGGSHIDKNEAMILIRKSHFLRANEDLLPTGNILKGSF